MKQPASDSQLALETITMKILPIAMGGLVTGLIIVAGEAVLMRARLDARR